MMFGVASASIGKDLSLLFKLLIARHHCPVIYAGFSRIYNLKPMDCVYVD